MRSLSRFRGCLLGGAAGDALGYGLEYLDRAQIEERYGASGLLGYDLTGDIARISDETQLTLFTANGLLLGKTRRCMRGETQPYPAYLAVAYLDWYRTQRQNAKGRSYCWIAQVPVLRHRRAPGTTCLDAFERRQIGTIARPYNQSHTSDAIGRVAPIGLFFDPAALPQAEIDRLGADAAAITHGHPLGWLSASAFVHLVSRITYGGVRAADLPELVRETAAVLVTHYGELRTAELTALLHRAVDLASSSLRDLDAIRALGEGWQAEEALAIAVLCLLRHADSFGECIIAAANHDGDSDATAAVAGNLAGALLGVEGIPAFFLDSLEARDLVDELARDLWADCPMRRTSSFYDEAWATKYIECRYDPD